MSFEQTPINILIAKSISAAAPAWRRGSTAEFSQAVLTYFGTKELRTLEDAIRHSADPERDAFATAMKIQQ